MQYESVQLRDGKLWFSPSDLSEYLGCVHATHLALEVVHGKREKSFAVGEYQQLIRTKGDEHEQEYLARLQADGREIVEIGWGDPATQARRTEELMRAGVDVIYQGLFAFDGWRGLADFVERVDGDTDLGAYGYEAVDTKLARGEAAPSHVLQLCFYSEGIARVQGVAPRLAHIQLGSGRRETIRLREFGAYYRRARTSFEQAVAADAATEPFPCSHCQVCDFQRVCQERWRSEDHLVRVAGLRRDQIGRLRAADVRTLTDLAELPAAAEVPDIRRPTLDGLSQQARLQREGELERTMPFELLPREAGRGFAKLPRPSAGDVMFDLEGDPFWTPARELTFLFGMLLREGDGWRYLPFWGHTPDEERLAFEQAVDLVTERLATCPGMHVFHYSPAEPAAIARLMATHATRELAVDDLLRRGILVDLLSVVKQAMRVGVESYSLKLIEKLAGFERSAEMGSGSDAVLGYERWRSNEDQAELDAIAAYNDEDCRATGALYDWLLRVRPADATWLEPTDGRTVGDDERAEQTEREQVRLELVTDEPEGSRRWLAGELLEYHRREARPGWWRYFAVRAMDEDELLDDGEALAGLEQCGPPVDVKRSVEIPLHFPAQQHKIGTGDHEDPSGAGVTVVRVDDEAGIVTIRRAKTRLGEALPSAIVSGGPFRTAVQQRALLRFARSVRDDDDRFAALKALVRRDPPRIGGVAAGAEIQTTDLAALKRLAGHLDRSTLVVQGPPGTGKTYTGARLIVDLIDRGARVGVTALSHKAINNLIEAIEEAADEAGVHFSGARKTTGDDTKVPDGDGRRVENVGANPACLSPDYRLVGATTWLFSDTAFENTFDYLVIDEAGQMSLADAIAAGTSARNLILLGDPLQLPQVSQAIHPIGTNASVLEHVLGIEPTIPPDRGIFLTESWRMHPDICDFISHEVYDDRLGSYVECARQATGAGTGIRYLPTPATGNAAQSPEEAEQIRAVIEGLLGQAYKDMKGTIRPLTSDDFMVVAPYNAQVRLLRQTLPTGVRVGTVDRFQGQEAPVVFFSMATSSGQDVPRNLAFLFSRNRLNVAISRARCLAYLVCSPALLEAKAKSVEDMRLISTLCSLVECSRPDECAAAVAT